MPVYAYSCDKCYTNLTDIRQVTNRNKTFDCLECDGLMQRAIGLECPGVISEGNIRISRSLAVPVNQIKSGDAFKTHPGAEFGKPNIAGMCPMIINSRSEKLRRIKERSKATGLKLTEI